jgi:hypothetical protein
VELTRPLIVELGLWPVEFVQFSFHAPTTASSEAFAEPDATEVESTEAAVLKRSCVTLDASMAATSAAVMIEGIGHAAAIDVVAITTAVAKAPVAFLMSRILPDSVSTLSVARIMAT